MSREILFKAKRKDNDEWIQGSLLVLDDGSYRIATSCLVGDVENVLTVCAYDVAPDTICQYTGLTDKNGNKIWENDICDRKEKYPEVVKQYQGDWVLDYSYLFGKNVGYNYCNLGFYACERKCVEVIGNIFDNAELLKGE